MGRKWKHPATDENLKRFYNWIADFMIENGYQPNLTEMSRGFGISFKTVHSWLAELQARGMVDRSPGNGRIILRGIYYVDDR